MEFSGVLRSARLCCCFFFFLFAFVFVVLFAGLSVIFDTKQDFTSNLLAGSIWFWWFEFMETSLFDAMREMIHRVFSFTTGNCRRLLWCIYSIALIFHVCYFTWRLTKYDYSFHNNLTNWGLRQFQYFFLTDLSILYFYRLTDIQSYIVCLANRKNWKGLRNVYH